MAGLLLYLQNVLRGTVASPYHPICIRCLSRLPITPIGPHKLSIDDFTSRGARVSCRTAPGGTSVLVPPPIPFIDVGLCSVLKKASAHLPSPPFRFYCSATGCQSCHNSKTINDIDIITFHSVIETMDQKME